MNGHVDSACGFTGCHSPIPQRRCDDGMCEHCINFHKDTLIKAERKKDPLNPWGVCENGELGNTIGGYYCKHCGEPMSFHTDLKQKRRIATLEVENAELRKRLGL